jgi:flagellar biosynthesis anti-sigma factor FlgM
MKITNNPPNPWLDAVGRSKTSEGAPPAGKAADEKPNQAEFPADHLEIRNAPGDEMRSAKVERLQRAIASGHYQVSSEDIAQAMLRDWQG